MEVPQRVMKELNISEDEVIDIIIECANRIAPKYVFGYYEAEDLVHEAIIIAFKALSQYKSGPLRNFLSSHLSRRMKNFKRDNYFRPGAANREAKMAIMNPIDITNINDECESNMQQYSSYIQNISYSEMLQKIDDELPVSYRRDYLRIRDDAIGNMSIKRKNEVLDKIREIIGDMYEEDYLNEWE